MRTSALSCLMAGCILLPAYVLASPPKAPAPAPSVETVCLRGRIKVYDLPSDFHSLLQGESKGRYIQIVDGKEISRKDGFLIWELPTGGRKTATFAKVQWPEPKEWQKLTLTEIQARNHHLILEKVDLRRQTYDDPRIPQPIGGYHHYTLHARAIRLSCGKP